MLSGLSKERAGLHSFAGKQGGSSTLAKVREYACGYLFPTAELAY